jgi:hypothetical protein
MNRFVLKKYFHKSIQISLLDKYFYKNKRSKLCFGDRVAVQNDFFYQYGGSVCIYIYSYELKQLTSDDGRHIVQFQNI